ncbi:MAG: cation diffusion facilitator family transporter [Acidimicrobiia bacterium]
MDQARRHTVSPPKLGLNLVGVTHSATAQHSKRLTTVLVTVLVFMVVELVTGILTGSLALISDAAHMGTDALGVGMALAAVIAVRGGARRSRTYGSYRLEILAALANTVLLFAVAGYVLWEALRRWANPVEVATGPMLAVAVLGLAVNLFGWRTLQVDHESLNIVGARLELLADLLGSIGVIVAALVVRFTGWLQADPLIAIALGLFVLPRAFRLGREAIRILVQEAPPHLDVGRIKSSLESIPHVIDIHDLHVWTLTSGMEVASAHLMIENDADPHSTLDSARELLQTAFKIDHATLQVEPQSHIGCTELSW